MQKHDEVKEELIQTDTEFRRLYQEHQDHERRLDQMVQNPRHLDRRRDRAQSPQDPEASPQGPHGGDDPQPNRGRPGIGLTAPERDVSPRSPFPVAIRQRSLAVRPASRDRSGGSVRVRLPRRRRGRRGDCRSCCLLFFRDPGSHFDGPDDVVVAPAWGKVLRVEAAQDPAVSPEPLHRIVTFLSVFDVHLQRAPISGRVVHSAEKPGRRVAAFRHDAGEVNAGRLTVIEDGGGDRVGVRQIVGLLARRIVLLLPASGSGRARARLWG